jgi:uncharacterized protein (TIGR00369 family)
MTQDNGLSKLAGKMPTDGNLQIPPPIFLMMEGEILEMSDTTLKAKFPVKADYRNPFGYMQGGMLVAAMDNTMGPLSFTAAPPNVTTQLNTTYIRPVTADDAYIIVEATVTQKTRRQLFLSATVTNPYGKVVCFAHASHMVVGES